ncbi:dihydrodipicolinate synthase family protein [Chloroflexota bacterium]
MLKIEGPVFAIVTPFDQAGNIDFGALHQYLAFLNQSGVKNVIVNGTTGEFASLTIEERKSVLEYCRGRFAGYIVAHVSACAVKDCITLLEHASQYSDAALILPPYYYSNATITGLQAFFESVIGRSSLPVYLYNFPKHTNIELKPDLVSLLCEKFSHIIGLKDSSGNLDGAIQLKSANLYLQVFMGGDSMSFAVLDKGLDGSVSGAGNPVPECLVGMHKAFVAGRKDIAREWQEIIDIWKNYRKHLDISEVAVIKAGLRARVDGFPVYVRPPFSAPGNADIDSVFVHITKELIPQISKASAIQS